MAFTDLIFLFVFLPLVWLLYTFGFKKVWGNPFLFLVSLIFCAWGSLYSLVVLLVVLVATYAAAKGLDAIKDEEERRKIVVYTSAFFLIVLLVYRYLPVWFSFLPFSRTAFRLRFVCRQDFPSICSAVFPVCSMYGTVGHRHRKASWISAFSPVSSPV